MTRKPTNSRMGKGKGSIKGFLIRASANRPFIITKGVSPRRISAFFKKEVGVSQLKFAVRAVVTSK
jgi:ribosomal protein L16/L10AE